MILADAAFAAGAYALQKRSGSLTRRSETSGQRRAKLSTSLLDNDPGPEA